MPKKHPNTERIGGPGASHENRRHPEQSQPRGNKPADTKSWRHSGVSGGGGEHDPHHTHDPKGKAGDDAIGEPKAPSSSTGNRVVRQSELPVSRGGMNQESDHNKHNNGGPR